jgi:hypothetical protein
MPFTPTLPLPWVDRPKPANPPRVSALQVDADRCRTQLTLVLARRGVSLYVPPQVLVDQYSFWQHKATIVGYPLCAKQDPTKAASLLKATLVPKSGSAAGNPSP